MWRVVPLALTVCLVFASANLWKTNHALASSERPVSDTGEGEARDKIQTLVDPVGPKTEDSTGSNPPQSGNPRDGDGQEESDILEEELPIVITGEERR